MGNRASIYVQPANQTIYLQWNGGPGSVSAFVDEAKRRSNQIDKLQPDFIFYLHAAIRDYFNFATDVKYRERGQLSLYVEPAEAVNDSDNGHYILDALGAISRECGKYCTTEDTDYTKESYDSITAFFAALDKILLAADFDESE